jgi:hypothetical protein
MADLPSKRFSSRRRAPNRSLALVMATGAALSSVAFGQATGSPAAPAGDESNAELRQKVEALEAKVDRLEGNQRRDEQDTAATQRQVLGIADQYSGPHFAGDLISGYDPNVGFVFRSADGDFSLHPGILLDFRNMTNYRENVPPKNGSEVAKPGDVTQNGIDITRARLVFDGRFARDFTYYVQFQDDQGTSFALLDAFVVGHLPNNSPWAVKVGQFKDPVWHERNLSEATLLAVDRSLTEYLIGGGQTGRVQGVDVIYDAGQLRAQAVFHDGFNSLNTKFFDAGGLGAGVGGGAGITPTDFGVTGRVEYAVIGQHSGDQNPFTEYDRQFTARGDTQDILVVGAGADYSQGGANDVIFHTVDAQYDNTAGWSAYAAYLGSYRDLHDNQGVAAGQYYDPGFLIQAAYLVTPKIEPFVRYDYTYLPTNSTKLTQGAYSEITVGANYYIQKQNVKFTVDATYLPNGAPSDSDALGILKNPGQNQFVLRAQFQLAL